MLTNQSFFSFLTRKYIYELQNRFRLLSCEILKRKNIGESQCLKQHKNYFSRKQMKKDKYSAKRAKKQREKTKKLRKITFYLKRQMPNNKVKILGKKGKEGKGKGKKQHKTTFLKKRQIQNGKSKRAYK